MMRSMRGARSLAFWLVIVLLGACQGERESPKKSPPEPGPAALAVTDTASGRLPELARSLDALRSAFNAGKGEHRFLTLLSPT
jgi:hypothetical protein